MISSNPCNQHPLFWKYKSKESVSIPNCWQFVSSDSRRFPSLPGEVSFGPIAETYCLVLVDEGHIAMIF